MTPQDPRELPEALQPDTPEPSMLGAIVFVALMSGLTGAALMAGVMLAIGE
jgi:hypothetical protein